VIGTILRLRYEVLEELPSSPIFENFVAKDLTRDVEVCVRVVHQPFASEPEFIAELASVIEKTKPLLHRNVARIYGMEEDGGKYFIVGEYVRGVPLAERIQRLAPFSASVSCEIAAGIAEALEYAGEAGIAHGDLCADNVLYRPDGSVAVLDFGLWQCYGASETAPGVVLGRMAPYLAPEVVQGGMPTQSSDVYALGVILFELLTGQRPFSGPTPISILDKHRSAPVPEVRTLNPGIPIALGAIVSRALAKQPAERYTTASEMLADLEAVLEALRFGKKIELQKPAVPAVTSSLPRREGDGDGTAMRRARKPRQPRDDDVPAWLRALMYMLGGMALLIVGAVVYTQFTKKPSVTVPNVVGMSLPEARATMQQVGLLVAIESEEYSDEFPEPQTVVRVIPAPGTPVYQGSQIGLVISLGSTRVQVPDLRGLSIPEARRQLDAVNLRLGDQVRYQQSTRFERGRIIYSTPGPGEMTQRESSIEVVVSSGRGQPDKPIGQTDDLTPSRFSLSFRVPRKDRAVLVRVEMVDARGESLIVFEEARQPGEEIALEGIEGFGERATFRIYYDNVLDSEVIKRGERE